MKKLFTAVILLLAVQLSSAQSADFKKDAIEYLKLSGSLSTITTILEPVVQQIPETKRADFQKELDGILPTLYEQNAAAIMKYFTHDDIKKMNEFYKTPIGKKMAETVPKMAKDQMEVGQKWGMELQGILMKYLQ